LSVRESARTMIGTRFRGNEKGRTVHVLIPQMEGWDEVLWRRFHNRVGTGAGSEEIDEITFVACLRDQGKGGKR
jgi:hypothetical protein